MIYNNIYINRSSTHTIDGTKLDKGILNLSIR